MSRRFSVFSFLFLLLTSYYLFLVNPIHAQTSDPVSADQPNVIKEKQDARKEGGNQEAWLNESMGSNVVSSINALVGDIPDEVLDGKLPPTVYIPGGALGITTKLVSALYSPVMGVSGIQYVASLKDSFLGKPAYAQTPGIGFAGLQPILPIWRGFRNFTYLFASVIFVLIGIMIMLRVKISNQAVINIQSAVPQIITTLVLITFSYAIAGIIIDLMQFIQSFVIALLFNVTGKGLTTNLFPLSIHDYTFNGLSTADMNTVAGLTQRAIPMAPFIIWSLIFGGVIGGIIGSLGGPVTALGGIGLAAAILILVLIICMLVWMFKFYFGCLKCYITAIFKIIIGPLEIAMGAFPNSKMGFNSWVWDIIANLSVFPISVIFLVLGNLIQDYAKNGLWQPGILGGASLQSAVVNLGIAGGLAGNVVSVGIGLAVIALMSKLPEMIPQFIFMIKPSPWEQAVGQSFASVAPGALIGSAAEKYKNYNMLTGRDAREDILNAGRSLKNRINKSQPSSPGTPQTTNKYGQGISPSRRRTDIRGGLGG